MSSHPGSSQALGHFDLSRFWRADQYRPGANPPSYDKQFVSDWLETQTWNKKASAPALPGDVLAKTTEKYREALRRLTGRDLDPICSGGRRGRAPSVIH